MESRNSNMSNLDENYINPIGTIRTLLQNLDAELSQLSKTCKLIKPTNREDEFNDRGSCKNAMASNDFISANSSFNNNRNGFTYHYSQSNHNNNGNNKNNKDSADNDNSNYNGGDNNNNNNSSRNKENNRQNNAINNTTNSNTKANKASTNTATTGSSHDHNNTAIVAKRNPLIKNITIPTNWLMTGRDIGTMNTRPLANMYRARVIDAYRNRRIFTIYGNYRSIRQALLCRGWIEKLSPGRHQKLQTMSEEQLLLQAKAGNEYETVVISKIINHFPAFFIWQPKALSDKNIEVFPHRNRVRRTRPFDFTTKIGLIGCGEYEHWYRFSGYSGMRYPRSYRLNIASDDRDVFIDDFRRTQCRSLVRLLVENFHHLDLFAHPTDGALDVAILGFAIKHLQYQLCECDANSFEVHGAEDVDWQRFLNYSPLILLGRCKFKAAPSDLIEQIIMGKEYLEALDDTHDDYSWDGCRNLWILKPGYKSCGIGILIKSSLDDILRFTMTNSDSKYIVQKYLERPLLIYKTKFDIRQYMLLVIGESMVKIWLYKDCYLRFSSQHFTVNDLRESIHLTNNSVQKRYRNSGSRDSRLPRNNMWSLEQFKLYLRSINVPEDMWKNKIFAGFRQNLIAVVLASFEETNFVENSFEMYGCDFMLDEQYNPILIEINSTPDLSASTDVTARICPMALKDLVKVIVDLPRNPSASTGLFEMVYEIPYKSKTDFDPHIGLPVTGKAMTLHQPQRMFKQRIFKKLMPNGASKTEKKHVRMQARKSARKKEVEKEVVKDSRVSKELKESNGLKEMKASKEMKISKDSNDSGQPKDLKGTDSKDLKDFKSSKTRQQNQSNTNVSPRNTNTNQGSKLKSSTKEALAMRYTKIK